jgi:hypothetical protein
MLQCNRDPEGCRQCFNAGRTCPGYRKLEDVIFKDESGNVARKIKARDARFNQKSASPAKSAIVVKGERADKSLEFVRSPPLPVFSLFPTIEDRAMSFFLANYVMPSDGRGAGHMAILTKMTEALPDCLTSSMKAVGLAGYAHSVHAPSLMVFARYQYVLALRSTNEALKSSVLVKKDSTLISILILNTYEAVTGTDRKSLKAWADHIFGAASLLRLRGREQLYTTEGRQLFFQTVAMLMVSSIQLDISLPDYIMEWTQEVKAILPVPSRALICQEAMMEFTSIHTRIIHGMLSDPDAILSRCLAVDLILSDAFASPSPSWSYTTIITDADPDIVYDGRYHIYNDHWVSQVWNNMRSVRCLLHDEIRRTLQPLPASPTRTAQLLESTTIMRAMHADILASVPQHLGYRGAPWTPPCDVAGTCGPLFLIWPLWHAGVMSVATEGSRQYAARNLLLIGREMGIRQAAVLATTVLDGSDVTFR